MESRPDLTRAASLGSGLVMEPSIQLSLGSGLGGGGGLGWAGGGGWGGPAPAWLPGLTSPVRAGHAHGPQLPNPACLPVAVGEDAAPNPIVCLQDGDLGRGGKQVLQLFPLAPISNLWQPPCTPSSIPTAAQTETREGPFFMGR